MDVASGFESIFKGTDKRDNSTLTRSIALNGISAGTTYIDINYTVVDPENKYNVVYATLTQGTESIDISLNKDETQYRITGLRPDSNYTVDLGYKIIYADAKTEDVKEDTMSVKTKKQTESLQITKVSTDKIYYTLRLDSNYVYDEGCKIAVYVNNEVQEDLEIELNSIMLENAALSGYTGSFAIPAEYKTKGNTIKLQLENTKYDGTDVSTNLTAKIVNY